MAPTRSAKPHWLRRRLPGGPQFERTRRLLQQERLHTVCQEANCPNIYECFSEKTATFLILGDRCTRNCTFCAVKHGAGRPLDPEEPRRAAEAAAEMGLTYVVVTSVTRDDLDDGGAQQFAGTIRALRSHIAACRIEVLIPDFQGKEQALKTVIAAGPDVLNHNIETVARLYAAVRPQADYHRSLALLERSAALAPHIFTKSGLMLGLGETEAEIEQVLGDLRRVGCRILTLGQYLQPTASHHPVVEYVPPETFDRWRDRALSMGFEAAACGPFVRSSYHAKKMFGAHRRGTGGSSQIKPIAGDVTRSHLTCHGQKKRPDPPENNSWGM